MVSLLDYVQSLILRNVMDYRSVVTLVGLGAGLIAAIKLKWAIVEIEELDTAMQVQKSLLRAVEANEREFGFRARRDINVCNLIGQLDFTQFRGRL